MGGNWTDLIRLRVRCTRDAPCVVRGVLDEALAGDELRQDARLVASELVTNAVRHSGGTADDLIEFRAVRNEQAVLISVIDPCLTGNTARLRRDRGSSGGFGLWIVDQLAREWGVERPNGHRVWAELTSATAL